MNNPLTYSRNPIYQINVQGVNDADNEILIDLKGPKYEQFFVLFKSHFAFD